MEKKKKIGQSLRWGIWLMEKVMPSMVLWGEKKSIEWSMGIISLVMMSGRWEMYFKKGL